MNAPTRRPLTRMALVIFDCDSTLSAAEGIDELAGGQRAAIEELTASAMSGAVPLDAVYGRRLELIRPHRAQLERLAAHYVERLVPDAAAVVAALHAEGIDVRIMSGGLRPAVLAVADALGVPHTHVGAVDIHFGDDGVYAGFDDASLLAQGRGKRALVLEWRRGIDGAVMLVGDGATDLEASDAVDLFVAYAGIIERAHVVAAADVVIRSHSLAPILPLALGGAAPRVQDSIPLHERGLALMDDALRRRLLRHTDD